MINFRKCKKLCVALSLSLLSFSFTNAMEKKLPDLTESQIGNLTYDQIEKFCTQENYLGGGTEGRVYRCSQHYVVKDYFNNKKSGPNTDIELMKKLEGRHLGDNLVRIVKIVDNKYVFFEYLKGKEYKNLMLVHPECRTIIQNNFPREVCTLINIHEGLGEDVRLSINYFIDKWVIGTIEGMEKIHKLTGRYLGDRHVSNFFVRNFGSNEPVLTLIDYSFANEGSYPYIDFFVDIFQNIMEKNVDKNDKRWILLYNYLETIKNKTFKNANVILHELTRIRNSK